MQALQHAQPNSYSIHNPPCSTIIPTSILMLCQQSTQMLFQSSALLVYNRMLTLIIVVST